MSQSKSKDKQTTMDTRAVTPTPDTEQTEQGEADPPARDLPAVDHSPDPAAQVAPNLGHPATAAAPLQVYVEDKPTKVEETERKPMPLMPADSDDMFRMSTYLAKAQLVPDALRGKPNDVFVVLMSGRELGLQPMQALMGLNVIHGKIFTSAQLLVGMVNRSGLSEWFRCSHTDATSATYITRRKGWGGYCSACKSECLEDLVGQQCPCGEGIYQPQVARLTFTLDDAKAYGLLAKQGSNYKSKPAVMLRWRAASQLARDVYPEATLGLYTEDERQDFDPGPEMVDEPGPGVEGLKATLARRGE